ncbi:MAG: helix-turn-helix domain-containing protein [Promethearchaeota archaeon]
MSNKEKVIDAFKKTGKPLKNAEIVEFSGLDKAEVTKIMKSLKEEGIVYSPKRCYYDLK